jgi:predicted nucleotidyltransferase
MPRSKFLTILGALHEANVEFIVVGGLAAVLNGAPLTAYDLEVLHSRHPSNLARLLPVLERFGPLDLLGTIGRNLSYQDLLPHSVEMNIGEGIRIRVLDLETLIAVKEELGGEKDRAMLPTLRRTLEEKKKLG